MKSAKTAFDGIATFFPFCEGGKSTQGQGSCPGGETVTGIAKMDSPDTTVGANIRRRRIELGLSAHDLGAAVGVSEQYVERVEAGEVRLDAPTLFRLASVLRCKMSDFFAADDPGPSLH